MLKQLVRSRVVLALLWGVSTARLYAAPASFEGHRVVQVTIGSPADAAMLASLGLDIWTCDAQPRIGKNPVRVSPEELVRLQQSGLVLTPWIDDIGPLIAQQRQTQRGLSFHQSYHTLAQIHTEVQQYATAFPAIAQTLSFGTSLENRDLLGLRITGPGGGPNKPGIFIFGGEHAREWIGPAVMMYIADWLLTNYGSDSVATDLVNRLEWFILPVMNADGYEFSWTDQRFWRKNRRNNGDSTFGVDLNRNWGYEWGGEGSSGSTNSETYRGPIPFSEPETQALRDFVLAHPNIRGVIDFHSFSELILWPWGYTPTLTADNDLFAHLGQGMHDRIEAVHGHSYTYGPIYTAIYPASGVSADWIYATYMADHFVAAMSIELRDTGASGFLLPPEQIIPTSEENLQAVLFLAEELSIPLRVALASPVPPSLAPDQALSLMVEVTPVNETVVANGVTASYRISPGDFTTLAMQPLGGDLFEVTLPGSECGGDLQLYISAVGNLGGVASQPQDAPQGVISVPVGVTYSHVTDHLESDSGWNVGGPGDTATTGVWVRVDPLGTTAQPEDDFSPAPGNLCFVTGQGPAGGSVGANDVDGGATTLFSPVFEVPVESFKISFAHWFYSTETGPPAGDALTISVSNNGGSSWVPFETINHNTDGWVVGSFYPADVGLAATNQMMLRFAAADLGGGTIVEAAVDDLLVTRFGCADGDFDDNDAIDLGDFLAISQCLNGPSSTSVPAACGVFNFNYDIDVDMTDFLDFQLRFGPVQ